MGNPIRYIDQRGADAGDTFKSADKAAKDFGKEINGKSIEENLEYGAFIYSWKEDKKILGLIPITKTYYSYTEPFSQDKNDMLALDPTAAEIPDGAVVVAGIHTHKAFDWGKYSTKLAALDGNDNFSDIDKIWVADNNMPLYLVNPAGALKKWKTDSTSVAYGSEKIELEWTLPHDKNHPSLPENHKKNCKDCHVMK